MSTNASLFLTDQNEHWYHDVSEKEFVLEIGREHFIDSQGMGEWVVVVSEGTSLYQQLMKLKYGDNY